MLKSRRGRLAIVAAIAAVMVGIYHMSRSRTLRVAFPLQLLRQDQKILDPDNTELVYQYYLLENLAVGLVRDSVKFPSGYEPILAQSWKRQAPNKWVFQLRPGLKWSDGSPIDSQVVAEHLRMLRNRDHRHIVYLKRLSRVEAKGRTLTLEFSESVNEGLIHELSLADAALLHPGNRKGRWDVVSGPYAVKEYALGETLLLERNPFYAGGADYPDRVALLAFSMKNIDEFFDTTDIDLMYAPTPAFRKPVQRAVSRAPQQVLGYPTGIWYFYFNAESELWRGAPARREFTRYVREALSENSSEGLAGERQFIPKGFVGRLKHPPPLPAPGGRSRLAGKSLKFNLPPPWAEALSFREGLTNRFSEAGIPIKFQFKWSSSPEAQTADVILSQFAGNQKDALGSWKFLFSGPLGRFRSEVESLFQKVMVAQDVEGRTADLENLHRKVLEAAYGVPLFVEPAMLLASKRVDLSGINRFDMRLRFYEVQWK